MTISWIKLNHHRCYLHPYHHKDHRTQTNDRHSLQMLALWLVVVQGVQTLDDHATLELSREQHWGFLEVD